MDKVYKTNLVKGVYHEWENSKCIMEVYQNYVDSDCDQRFIDFTDDSITFTNTNIKLSHKILLMGLSDKREENQKLGKHGIGLIQALAVLTYRGITVTLYNNHVVWTPEYRYCEDFDHEVLVFVESNNPSPDTDYKVVIDNLSEDDIFEVKERCLELQEDREVLFNTDIGEVLPNPVDQPDTGEVFVGGIFVCQTVDFKYSYNFKPEHLPLNTERRAVDNWELKKLTAKIWKECPDQDLLMEAIKSKKEDCSLVMDSWHVGYSKLSVSEQFGEEYLAENPNTIVTSDFSEYESHIKRGNKVKYLDNSNQVKSIKESDAYQSMVNNLTIIEEESKETRLHTIREALQSYVDDNSGNYEEYEGKTLQDHLDELESIIDNEIY